MISKKTNSRFELNIKNIIFPNSKRSQGHLEIILSMVIFVGFLIFVLIILSPAFKTKQVLPIRDIQIAVIDEISSDFGKLSVVVDPPGADTLANCYHLSDVIDEFGINWIEISGQPRSYTILFGDFFDSTLIGVSSCTTTKLQIDWDFTLGVFTKESIIIEQKILDLKTSYDAGYTSLKQSLKIGDFSFSVRDLSGNIIQIQGEQIQVTNQIPNNIDVFSKDIPIRVMNNQGTIQELILNIRTWG